MLTTKSNRYTFQKSGVWYFSRRVPNDLRRHYRTGRIAYSLRTKSISIFLSSIFIFSINSSQALAEQKYWALLWNSYFVNQQLINTSQHGQVFNTKEDCHIGLKAHAFWQKENNDNDHFKDMSIEFLTPDRLVARVSGQNAFSQLSCVQLKLDQE